MTLHFKMQAISRCLSFGHPVAVPEYNSLPTESVPQAIRCTSHLFVPFSRNPHLSRWFVVIASLVDANPYKLCVASLWPDNGRAIHDDAKCISRRFVFCHSLTGHVKSRTTLCPVVSGGILIIDSHG